MSEAPGLTKLKNYMKTKKVPFSGIVGDSNHTYGYHVPSSRLGSSDYSMQGKANKPVGNYACAIDIGMGFKGSREWLAWLIKEIREDRIKGIAEVIGSFDGKNVRYWSDASTPSWQQNGVKYTGSGHDSWSHVAVYRSTAKQDRTDLLKRWFEKGTKPPVKPPVKPDPKPVIPEALKQLLFTDGVINAPKNHPDFPTNPTWALGSAIDAILWRVYDLEKAKPEARLTAIEKKLDVLIARGCDS